MVDHHAVAVKIFFRLKTAHTHSANITNTALLEEGANHIHASRCHLLLFLTELLARGVYQPSHCLHEVVHLGHQLFAA